MFANAGWMLLDRLLRIAISVVVGAWVARYLGPDRYGELAYVLAMLALFYAACGLGLDGPVVRDITQDPHDTATVLGTAFRLRLAAGVVGWLSATAIVVALRPDDYVAFT